MLTAQLAQQLVSTYRALLHGNVLIYNPLVTIGQGLLGTQKARPSGVESGQRSELNVT